MCALLPAPRKEKPLTGSQLNTSRIDYSVFQSQIASSGKTQSTYGSYVAWLVENELNNKTAKITYPVWQDINDYHRSIAADLGLRDFYSLHVLDMCWGYWGTNASGRRNVTYCQPTHGLNTPKFTLTLIDQLAASPLNLNIYKDVQWPGVIARQIRVLRFAYRAMGALYFISIAATGAALIGSVVGLFTHGRLSAILNIGLALLAFLSLTIASACATAAMTKTVNIINGHADKINCNAARGDRFLAMTWIAVVLSFIAALAWEGELGVKVVRHKRQQPRVEDESIEHIKE